jgi:pimeloyl-ACP methyl ester carboxylesterase
MYTEGALMPHTRQDTLRHAVRSRLNTLRQMMVGSASNALKLKDKPQNGQRGMMHTGLRRALRHFIKTSHATVLLVGCLHAKAMVNGEFNTKKNHWQNNRGLSIANPKSKAVIVYLHGSVLDKLDDRCDPNNEVLGESVPEVIQQLSGTEVLGLEVMVFAPCHGRATNLGEPLKIEQRVQAIDETLKELSRAGIEPSQIFLVGQSAGGWAALLHQKRHPQSVNAVVAFAPAFAGKKRLRPEIWQQRHELQAAEILSANLISSLVFAFKNDDYNSQDDLDFLSRVKGTTLLKLPGDAIAGIDCDIPLFGSSHRNAFRKCFDQTQSTVVRDFLQQRLSSEMKAPHTTLATK